MNNIRSIIKRNSNLTSYKFYTEFLQNVATVYHDNGENIVFELFEKGDENIYDTFYKIDPLVIPLLLSLLEQLSKFHRHEIPLILYNNKATIGVLEFLFRTDFFYISGDNKNPTFPIGRNIAEFNEGYLGTFSNGKIRNEHRVRAYSLDEDGLGNIIADFNTEEQKRDYLISHYTYKVREHFEELLFDNPYTANFHNNYIDVLSELITNAVLHSKSSAYALMFVNRFTTKFSISDNGVGFEGSMSIKPVSPFYQRNTLKHELKQRIVLKNISPKILDNLFSIFETLYYSSLKDRHGLFDLMINVVLNSQGYFRLHCENSQIIISNRMKDELYELSHLRSEIYNVHTQYMLEFLKKDDWENALLELGNDIKSLFLNFCNTAISKYSEDIKYSSIRFYPVKFRGVHIEVEIPNTNANDYLEN